MRIGVVSDTHAQLEFTRNAVQMLSACDVEQVIHCGDIGSCEIVRQFDAWPTHFVFGNVDSELKDLRAAMAAGGHACHEWKGELELAGRRIAFLHGDDSQMLHELVHSGRYDLVCHGHTHVAAHSLLGKTHVLNPGALYRARYHSLALVELPTMEITEVRV